MASKAKTARSGGGGGFNFAPKSGSSPLSQTARKGAKGPGSSPSQVRSGK